MNKTVIRKDENGATLTVERVFSAPRNRVWRAFTEPEILDQWWAPRPWKAQTLSMEFRVGGYWHYSMNGPNGETHYGRMDYTEIEPEESFSYVDVFADASGAPDTSLPGQTSATTFIDDGKATKVIFVVKYETPEDLQTVIEMGIEQGVTMAQDQLEELLGKPGAI